jgi:hypothetical protein
MLISLFDIILLNITSYLLGISSGLLFCCKYKDRITRSRSMENISRYNHHDNPTGYPPENNIVVATAPLPPAHTPVSHNPVKLTIE